MATPFVCFRTCGTPDLLNVLYPTPESAWFEMRNIGFYNLAALALYYVRIVVLAMGAIVGVAVPGGLTADIASDAPASALKRDDAVISGRPKSGSRHYCERCKDLRRMVWFLTATVSRLFTKCAASLCCEKRQRRRHGCRLLWICAMVERNNPIAILPYQKARRTRIWIGPYRPR